MTGQSSEVSANWQNLERRRLPALALGAIVLASAAGNLWWIAHNQMLMGRDASGYLLTTLDYRGFLSPLSWRGIFEAFVYPPYRTPAIYIAAQPWLALSLPGGAMDSVQLLNVLLHAVTILLTWGLARTFAGQWTSLLAAALVAFLPQMAAMARLFYTEALLVMTVTLNLLALYRSEGFARRGWSLVWGASAGVGLLVKWTFPIYIALPLVVVLWRTRRTLLHPPVWNLPAALLGVAAGALFVAIWWLPHRDLAATLPAGAWAALGWFLIVADFVYALLTSRVHGRWFAAAALLALWIASLWYLPHSDFVQTLLATDIERGSNPLGPLDWKSYAEYVEYWYQQHVGALLFWVMIPAAAAPWLWRLLRDRVSLCPPADLLWWSLFSALLVLTQISQRNARNLVPLLPAVAILIALGIGAWSRMPRIVLSAAAICVLLLQWSVITFDGMQTVYAAGRALWVLDEYAMPPASAKTAEGYNIAPEVLQRVTNARASGGIESLGLLVNADSLHRGTMRYLAGSLSLPVEIHDLTEADATWQNVIDSQWLLVKDGDNNNAELAALAQIDRIANHDALFDALYSPEEHWLLPNGETVSLYHRDGPGFPDADLARATAALNLAERLFIYNLSDTTLLYGNPDLAVWLGRIDPPGRPRVLPVGERGDEALLAGMEGVVAAVLDSNTLAVEEWLDQHGMRAATFTDGDMAIVYYDMTHGASVAEMALPELWDTPRLLSIASLNETMPGSVLPLETEFDADAPGIKWSVRLLDGEGEVLAANDRPVLARDRFGLLLPAHLPLGEYRVVARLYDEATLAPIPDHTGAEEVVLFTVSVR